MTTTKAIIISVISAIVITALGLVAFVGLQAKSNGVTLGSQIQNDTFWFTNGVTIGQSSGLVGSSARYNTLNQFAASSTTQGSLTLGAFGTTTSTAVITTSVPDTRLAVGDPCILGDTSILTASGTFAGLDGQVTAVSSTAGYATVTASVQNETSTVQTIATGTLEAVCFNTPF